MSEPPEPKDRPAGVTVLAILNGLFAVLLLLAGMVLVMAGPLIGFLVPFAGPFAGLVLGLFGLFLVFLGVVGVVVTWGMWNGKQWAWWLTIIFSILIFLMGITTLPAGVVSLIISGATLFYFTRPHVKSYFGLRPVNVSV